MELIACGRLGAKQEQPSPLVQDAIALLNNARQITAYLVESPDAMLVVLRAHVERVHALMAEAGDLLQDARGR